MHAALALSAAHVQVHKTCTGRSLDEMMHLTEAISLFRNTIDQDWDQNADAVLGTAYFLNGVSFVDHRLVDDPSITLDLPSFGWIRMQIGITQLLCRASERSKSHIWIPFFRKNTPDAHLIYDERSGTNGIPDAFVNLFEVTEQSTCDGHPYLRPLRRLCQIMKLERSTKNASMFINFCQGVSTNFVDLLESLDARALLLFSYWLGYMCSVELWWCKNRVRNECRSICSFLTRWHPELTDVLMFPAACCGFKSCSKEQLLP